MCKSVPTEIIPSLLEKNISWVLRAKYIEMDLIYILKEILITGELLEDSGKPKMGKENKGFKL